MTFKTVGSLEAYINSKMEQALLEAQEVVFRVIDEFVQKYYAEFSPAVYHRTKQLMNSLVKSEIRDTGKGKEIDVYFDISKLDYSMKYLNGRWVPNKGWSEEKTLNAAAHGSHGGYTNGTSIFYGDPLNTISRDAVNMLVDMLKKNGIPIKK